ncbi:MAG TPA: cell division protein FtsZ [Candidatus Marinimicrobia bacterium]|nr:cell division protein FtsZ [Candidatus Neomarinimicrobiota bacterium]HRS51703.1 cell division protein FtsZ [Candidatus Neomarinimicrobiota bacterium]HRU92147.1 cell division protein FtsZ [Candidatus Neomarinimicrobiota bacterium]
MLFEFEELANQQAKTKVIGIGGGGGNAITRMIENGLTGVDFVGLNTDIQALDRCKAPIKYQIGRALTRGRGAGAIADIGRKAAEADRQTIATILENTDMVFIAAGMGGGTGTGAAPIVAQLAREQGSLTVGIVTKPFNFEGPKRMARAEEGIAELKKCVDTLIVIPNQKLLAIVERNTSIMDAFKTADSVLYQAIRGISDLINKNGVINLDFADVRTIMKNMGEAIMGTGLATGEERAVLAAQQAISSPLLDEVNIKDAKGLLINITGPTNLDIHEVDEACSIIRDEVGSNAETIFGMVVDENYTDEIMITVIATGFGEAPIPINLTANTEVFSFPIKNEPPKEDDIWNRIAEPGQPVSLFNDEEVLKIPNPAEINAASYTSRKAQQTNIPTYLRYKIK